MNKILNVILIVILLFAIGAVAYSATRSIVPRTDSEGSIGTSAKVWKNAFFDYASTTIASDVGTVLTGVWNGTDIDIGDATNLTAGRSITLTGDDVAADTELYDFSITFKLVSTSTSAISTSTQYASHYFSVAATITGSKGWCDGAATTSVSMEERINPETIGGTEVFGGDSVADMFKIGDNSATTTFDNAGIAAGAWTVVALEGYNIGTPTRCFLSVWGTKDD